jgi:hypothetical protein
MYCQEWSNEKGELISNVKWSEYNQHKIWNNIYKTSQKNWEEWEIILYKFIFSSSQFIIWLGWFLSLLMKLDLRGFGQSCSKGTQEAISVWQRSPKFIIWWEKSLTVKSYSKNILWNLSICSSLWSFMKFQSLIIFAFLNRYPLHSWIFSGLTFTLSTIQKWMFYTIIVIDLVDIILYYEHLKIHQCRVSERNCLTVTIFHQKEICTVTEIIGIPLN